MASIVASLKSAATRKINKQRSSPGTLFWQRGYHEHVIRNDKDLRTHQEYIQNNPLKWTLDEYYREMEIIKI